MDFLLVLQNIMGRSQDLIQKYTEVSKGLLCFFTAVLCQKLFEEQVGQGSEQPAPVPAHCKGLATG